VIVDSSVLVAVAMQEPGWQELVERLARTSSLGMAAPTVVECGMVLRARLGVDPEPLIDRMLRTFGIVEIDFGSVHRREALEAFHRFGKGRHPAALNFGDCISYATARVAGRSLLYVGDDFAQTDLA
jgi:ribonuclease VapC